MSRVRKYTSDCAFAECNRRAQSLKLCRAHYKQQLAGHVLTPIKVRVASGTYTFASCKFVDCDRSPAAHGYCKAHDKQRRKGRTLTPIRVPTNYPKCRGAQCSRVPKKRGFCETHYQRWRAGSSTDLPIGPNYKLGQRKFEKCIVPSCKNDHFARGYCPSHLAISRKYGLDPIEFERMSDAQNQRCAICNRECQIHGRLSVDHCHSTGAVRGLLCARCNEGLGSFKDDPELLKKAVVYLRRSRLRAA